LNKKRFAGIKAVCFDLAGTLCDIPIGGQWEAINAAGITSVLGRLGISGQQSDELTDQFIDEKKRLRKEAKTSLREYEIRGQLRDFLGHHGIAIDNLDAAVWNELEFLFIRPELDITVRFDDTKAILEYLKKKYPLYLLSNNVSRMLVEKILAKLGLSEYFDAVYVSDIEEAVQRVMAFIDKGKTIGFGGSMTIRALGIADRAQAVGAVILGPQCTGPDA